MSDIHPAVKLLFILYITLHLGVPLSSWLMLRVQADKQTHLFFTGLGIYCISIVLTMYRMVLPLEIGYIFSSTLSCLSLFIVVEVLRRELTPQRIPLWIYGLLIALWAGLQQWSFIIDSLLFHGVLFSSLGYAIFDLLLAYFGLRIYKRYGSKNILLITLAGAVSTCAQIIKIHWLLSQSQNFDLLGFNWQSNFVLVVSYLSLLFVNFGYFGYSLEKSQRLKNEALMREHVAETYAQALHQLNQKLEDTVREKEELLRNLTLSSKAIGMGALAGALAHELNQPLTAIGLEAQGQLMKMGEPMDLAALQTCLQRINVDAQRAADIIRKLRTIFTRESSAIGRVPLRPMIDDICSLALPQTRHQNIEVRIDCDDDLCVQADPTQLHQVILNLLTNAIHSIEAQKSKKPLQGLIELGASRYGDRIQLTLRDNGTGFPLDWDGVIEVFDSRHAKGMGIGLWLSHKIVQLHGGELHFANRPQGGARVSVDFANADLIHIG